LKGPIAILTFLAAIRILWGSEMIPGATRGARPDQAVADTVSSPAFKPGSGRGMVLFVEDPGDQIFGPAVKPDPIWRAALQRILQASDYDWYGPTTDPTQNGPDLAVMENYHLVIWNVYDYWWSINQGYPAALTLQDQVNIQDYLAAGGKVWLIGQDLILSGVDWSWLRSNFHVAAADTDYWSGSTCLVQDRLKIPYQTVMLSADYQANGFWPDALTPDSLSATGLIDMDHDRSVALIHPLTRPISASFWTIDGRQPNPLAYWDYITRKMLYAFGLPVSIIDAGIDSIDVPRVIFENSVIYPRAVVKNLGSETDTFPVHCLIEPGGYDSQLNLILLPDSTRLVTFPDSFIFTSGFYTITVYALAHGDMDHRNDTLLRQVEATNWLYYDDGIPGSVWAWDDQNNGWGVQFPLTSECFADSIAICIGDDSWPIPGGDTATFRIYRGSGRPDTLRQEIRRVQIERGTWNFFALDTTLNYFPAGADLFIFYIQVYDLPYCPGLTFDRMVNHPSFMWQLYNDSFSVSLPGGDWMIRGHVLPILGIAEETSKNPAKVNFRVPSITGPRTVIEFSLDRPAEVKIRIFDVNGRLRQTLLRGSLPAGQYRQKIRIDQAVGVYFLRFDAGGGQATTRKIVLVK
jgi:hypothetical protein